MTEISIVLPAYHEAENLVNILPRLNRVLTKLGKPYEILVIDTEQPTDNTAEICRSQNARCIPRTGGNLYGDAIRTGFSAASGRFLVVMDADGSHDPAVIPKMYRTMVRKKAGLIIGSRYCKNGSTDNNAVLRFMSWILNVTYRTMFGLRVKDVSDSFRMYRTQMLRTLQFECSNFDIVEEILIRLHYQYPRAEIIEIPIRFSKRAAGESKRDLFKFILSYLSTMKKLLKIKHSIRGKRR
ncbi:MAG: glycosyltransferase [Oscillospiraceae bacterium]|nr:glycosyltransferase [Oscillospiraceae bacterium]